MKELLPLFVGSLKESLNITLIIFVLMVVVEILILKFQDKIIDFVRKNRFVSYVISSFFGIIPGCVGTFAMDSLYMSGLLGFGGIIAVMIATSGDEAFLMMSMVAKGEIAFMTLLSLVAILFALGVIGAFIADFFRRKTKMSFCTKCKIVHHKKVEFKLDHFIKEHLINHILKKHIWKIFLWIFMSLFIIGLVQDMIVLDFSGRTMFFVLIIASLVGLLPISGPNIFLVVMFSKGLIPFSVLLANSIIQDGHGLLPIMGFSMDDAVKIKLFNLVFGLAVGVILLFVGF